MVTLNYCHAPDWSFETVIIDAHSFSQLCRGIWILNFPLESVKWKYVACWVWILVHFCILCRLKTNHPTLRWSLFNILYLKYDQAKEKMVNLFSDNIVKSLIFGSNDMEKWDCDNKSLECLYWTSRTLLHTVQHLHRPCTVKYLHNTKMHNYTIAQWNICIMHKVARHIRSWVLIKQGWVFKWTQFQNIHTAILSHYLLINPKTNLTTRRAGLSKKVLFPQLPNLRTSGGQF